MKRFSITSEDSPLTPEQLQEYYFTINDFYSDKNPEKDRERLGVLFRIYDRNGDGCITARELKVIMTNVCPEGMSDFEIGTIIKREDLNGDSTIDFEEFSKMMLRCRDN